jgi:Flp pilus assembly protein TadB
VAEEAEPQERRDLPLGEPGRGRKRAYFWLMGLCLLLIVLAWNVVRLWSVPAAVAMSIVAAVIPPTAAIVANWGRGG